MSELTLAATVARDPVHAAVIDADTGEVTTYEQLERSSETLSQFMASLGLVEKDHIAILMDNTARYFEVCWAAQRSGISYTPINWHLNADEAAYILDDCEAKVFFATPAVGALAVAIAGAPRVTHRFSVGGAIDGFDDLDEALATLQADGPTPSPVEGLIMFYSSGTTGRPKGILRPYSGAPYGTGIGLEMLMSGLYEFNAESVYLCPAPLYHAAPLGWSMGTLRLGGTVVMMRQFDPIKALA